jgi:hypothetical protein
VNERIAKLIVYYTNKLHCLAFLISGYYDSWYNVNLQSRLWIYISASQWDDIVKTRAGGNSVAVTRDDRFSTLLELEITI